MQKVTQPKRFYIDHNSTDHSVEVRTVSCAWPQRTEHKATEIRQPATQTERLLTAGRLVRGGLFRKR